MSAKQFKAFKQKASRFFMQDRYLYRRPTKGNILILVVDDPQEKRRIIAEMHIHTGHRKVRSTYEKIKIKWFWHGMYRMIKEMIRVCPTCQEFDSIRPVERSIPAAPLQPMMKIHLDSQYMPKDKGCQYLMEARCRSIGWLEVKPMRRLSANGMRTFFQEITYRFGMIVFAVIDGGPEMADMIRPIIADAGVKTISISPYNPKANGPVESGHYPLTLSLAKMSKIRPG